MEQLTFFGLGLFVACGIIFIIWLVMNLLRLLKDNKDHKTELENLNFGISKVEDGLYEDLSKVENEVKDEISKIYDELDERISGNDEEVYDELSRINEEVNNLILSKEEENFEHFTKQNDDIFEKLKKLERYIDARIDKTIELFKNEIGNELGSLKMEITDEAKTNKK